MGSKAEPGNQASEVSNRVDDINLADGIDVLGYLFAGADPPPPPFPRCGVDLPRWNVCARFSPCP